MELKITLEQSLKKLWKDKRCRISCVATLILCFIAHAYGYFNATIIHDRREFFMEPILNSAKRAKWMAQYFDLLTSFAYLPWLSGFLSIIFIAISVYLIVKILDIKKNLHIVLVAGICVTNFSVLGAHFYWPHEILAAFPLACFSAYFWKKQEWPSVIRIFGEILFVGLSLATYGAYTSVAPTLVLLVCVTALMEGETWVNVLKKGMEYIVSFLAGMAFYYAVQRMYVYFQGIQILSYMGEDKLMTGATIPEIMQLIVSAYKNTISYYLGFYHEVPAAMPPNWARVILLLGVFLFIYVIIKKWNKMQTLGSKILLLLLLLAAPLSAGIIYVMSFGNVHFLMIFTYALLYIFLLKLVEMTDELVKVSRSKRYIKAVSGVLICMIILWGYRSIMICNMAYMRLENNYIESQSIATRLLDRIESCEGFEGSERVVFVGSLTDSEYFLGDRNVDEYYLEYFNSMGPVDKSVVNSFTFDDVMYDFLTYVMGSNLTIEKYNANQFTAEENKTIGNLTAFPANGSIIKLNDKIIVRLSN